MVDLNDPWTAGLVGGVISSIIATIIITITVYSFGRTSLALKRVFLRARKRVGNLLWREYRAIESAHMNGSLIFLSINYGVGSIIGFMFILSMLVVLGSLNSIMAIIQIDEIKNSSFSFQTFILAATIGLLTGPLLYYPIIKVYFRFRLSMSYGINPEQTSSRVIDFIKHLDPDFQSPIGES